MIASIAAPGGRPGTGPWPARGTRCRSSGACGSRRGSPRPRRHAASSRAARPKPAGRNRRGRRGSGRRSDGEGREPRRATPRDRRRPTGSLDGAPSTDCSHPPPITVEPQGSRPTIAAADDRPGRRIPPVANPITARRGWEQRGYRSHPRWSAPSGDPPGRGAPPMRHRATALRCSSRRRRITSSWCRRTLPIAADAAADGSQVRPVIVHNHRLRPGGTSGREPPQLSSVGLISLCSLWRVAGCRV